MGAAAMTAPSWMPFYVANYLADTGHLSTLEHGAYLLLIMHYWQNEGLPVEDGKLARICRMTLPQWKKIRSTLADFFSEEWRHDRIDEEIERSREIARKRKDAGKAGAEARHGKCQANSKANAKANAEQSDTHIHIQLHNKDTSSLRSEVGARGRARGTRLPEGWALSAEGRAYARAQGMADEAIDREAERFANYWHARAGPQAVKLDWEATWRNWILKAIEDGRGKHANGTGTHGGAGQSKSARGFDAAVAAAHRFVTGE